MCQLLEQFKLVSVCHFIIHKVSNLAICCVTEYLQPHSDSAPSQLKPTRRYDPVTPLQTFRDILYRGPKMSDSPDPSKHHTSHDSVQAQEENYY